MDISAFKENIIYMVKTAPTLPNWYLDFSLDFQAYNIKLIPILLKDLKTLMMKEPYLKENIIVITTNFTTKEYFEKKIKKFLTQLVKNKKVNIYHISSFDNNQRYQLTYLGNYYHFFEMPADLKNIAREISKSYYQDEKKTQLWPGGKRAKLPPNKEWMKHQNSKKQNQRQLNPTTTKGPK